MNNSELTKINSIVNGLLEEKSIILANNIGKLFGGEEKEK